MVSTVIIHNDYVFVCNPRTASRSTMQALIEVLDKQDKERRQVEGQTFYQNPYLHHPKTSHPALTCGKEVIGVVRNPYDTIVSWYHYTGIPSNTSFRDFVTSHEATWLYKGSLVVYGAYMTRALNYDLGVNEIVRRITGDTPKGDYQIGATGPQPDLWTPELMEIAKSRFEQDFIIYESTI